LVLFVKFSKPKDKKKVSLGKSDQTQLARPASYK